jgi:hypothetical protein
LLPPTKREKIILREQIVLSSARGKRVVVVTGVVSSKDDITVGFFKYS